MKWTNKGHQFDDLGKIFEKKNKIYIYGAGEYGATFFNIIKFMNVVDAFIDRDAKKQENGYLGLPVISPDFLYNSKDENHIIVVAASLSNQKFIMNRLKKFGYIEGLDCFVWKNFIDFDYYIPIYWLYAQGKIALSSGCIIPSTQCNLNCKCCLNFNPYLDHNYIKTIEELKKDIDIFFSSIDYLPEYQVSGGEPLLYSGFSEIVTYIGEKYRFKIGQFETVTNGTIVPNDNICEVMEKYNVALYLDNYTNTIPSKMDKRDAIIEKIEKYNIKLIDNFVDKWFDLDVENTDNSQKSDNELMEYYDFCNNPWHFYENGKMYACNFAAFAIKANLNIADANDFFDLTDMSDKRKKELLEFSLNYNEKGYVEFCKRCSGWSSINNKSIPVAEQILTDIK